MKLDRRKKAALAVLIPLALGFGLMSLRQARMESSRALYQSLPRLQLQMGQAEWASIRQARDKAVEKGIHQREKGDLMDARLVFDGARYQVSTRLKGDKPDHWSDPVKWSLRVKVKGVDWPFGIKKFSLQDPETRGGIWEVVAHELLREGGVIPLRHHFVTLQVNGREWGLALLEEHAGTVLAEHERGPGALAFKFDENLFWREYHDRPDSKEYYLKAKLILYGKKGSKGSNRRRARARGKALLAGFKSGKLPASKVFNVERFAWAVAVCDLLDSYPSLALQNLKLVWVPGTGRFEPVGGELSTQGKKGSPLAMAMAVSDGGLRQLGQSLLADAEFSGYYHQALKRLAAEAYVERFLQSRIDRLQHQARLCSVNRHRNDSPFQKDLRWLSQQLGLAGDWSSDPRFSLQRLVEKIEPQRRAIRDYLKEQPL